MTGEGRKEEIVVVVGEGEKKPLHRVRDLTN